MIRYIFISLCLFHIQVLKAQSIFELQNGEYIDTLPTQSLSNFSSEAVYFNDTLYSVYNINNGNVQYERFNHWGELVESGAAHLLRNGLEREYYEPLLFGGAIKYHWTREDSISNHEFVSMGIGDEISPGSVRTGFNYSFLQNKLDGIQKHQYDGESKSTISIAGYIVEGDLPDYYNWLGSVLKVGFLNPLWMDLLHHSYEEDLYYDLKMMIQIFLYDLNNHALQYLALQNHIEAFDALESAFFMNDFYPTKDYQMNYEFKKMEGEIIALAYGMNDDKVIDIKVDPEKWYNSSSANKWYILYHELGHDILNLKHGQGGRMMFNYPTKIYSWEEFFHDRDNMFLEVFNNVNTTGSKIRSF